ncbi:unnamed protein product [Rotaria sp. Silwood2]|nr:unnamed protein product [Rotaria sp. Silwood2]CAF3053174.1 unnamed protein product [Rotaria sp. Silwood2]CAF3929133.1 unnamed protein product [Rotaria sp. Silwood2]CAF4315833.1 unnamed protein product [Rotaria sp. Silwood2]
MASASLFEQLTSSVSLSMLAIVSVAILVLLLIYTVACRIFFSTSKSKTSTSKQHSNKDKKSKESNTIKKQQGDIASNNKKKTNKIKKNVLPVSSTSLPNTQSEESENEKTTLVESSKKSTSPIKTSASKKVAVIDENNKSNTSTNVIKTSSTKQQQPSIRTENVKESTGGQSEDNKNKQVKTNATPTSANTTVASNKQKPSGKQSKRNLTVDGEAGSDQEDEGQWLTQSSKQVNHRNRNKGKTEPSNTNNQPLSNHNVVSEQRSMPTISNSNISSSINNNELNVETTPPLIDNSISSIENSEPIEICQLLPTTENLYTSNDNWWKQALNKQQTFSIDDIGEWPEHEQDEQYIVQIKRIIPIKKLNEKQNSDDV